MQSNKVDRRAMVSEVVPSLALEGHVKTLGELFLREPGNEIDCRFHFSVPIMRFEYKTFSKGPRNIMFQAVNQVIDCTNRRRRSRISFPPWVQMKMMKMR